MINLEVRLWKHVPFHCPHASSYEKRQDKTGQLWSLLKKSGLSCHLFYIILYYVGSTLHKIKFSAAFLLTKLIETHWHTSIFITMMGGTFFSPSSKDSKLIEIFWLGWTTIFTLSIYFLYEIIRFKTMRFAL